MSVPRFPSLRERGAALVLALLVMALAAALASVSAVRVSRWLDRLQDERDDAQMAQLAKAALDWSCNVLEQDLRQGNTDHAGEAWAQPLPPIPTEGGGTLEGRIEDATARFNLNNLLTAEGKADPAWLAAYSRLLARLGLPESLASRLSTWVQKPAREAGAPPSPSTLRPAGRPLRHPGELAAIPGYSPEVMARLLPHIAVLPGRTTVNANTADADVLYALADSGREGLTALLEERQRIPFKDKADVAARLARLRIGLDGSLVDVASGWFLVHGRMTYRERTRSLEGLIGRNGPTARVQAWRTQ